MSPRALDRERMELALTLAERSIGLSDPNPRVGCVIGRDDGSLLGTGFTQRAGEAHAEVMALRDAGAAGRVVRGATAWVTLEPCAHYGRTPPCTQALVDAGVARVVVAMIDPYPEVAGKGVERLRAAGIAVDVAAPDVAKRAHELNIGFVSRMTRGRPWVRVKVAISLDGRTALPNGESRWITGEAARRDGHALRRRAGAVVTGIGTVLKDDPRLDVRLVSSVLQPLRVIMDSRWRTPLGARVLKPPGRALIVGLAGEAEHRRGALESLAETLPVPGPRGDSLDRLLDELTARQINEVHMEAGPGLVGAAIDAGHADEVVAYVATRLIGAGQPLAAIRAIDRLANSATFRLVEVTRLGEDVMLRVRSSGVMDTLPIAPVAFLDSLEAVMHRSIVSH